MSDDLTSGQIFGGRYRLERFLGEGATGVVWAATHVVTGRRVALKLLRRDVAQSRELRRRFVREARAACTINHPHVIQIHDVIEVGGEPPVLVMDLLEGETLSRRLEREGRIAPVALASVMLPVISAVQAAHRHGILHRDLKPENIFLCNDAFGRSVRVLDFGLAKLPELAEQSAALTDIGQFLGTPYYMAPEQVYGEHDIDARADIWSLGVILYECLSGVRPTQAVNLGQVLKRITTGRIPSLAESEPSLPKDLTTLVDRMLMRERSRRLDALDAVRAVLERYEAHAIAPLTIPAVDGSSPPVEGVSSDPHKPVGLATGWMLAVATGALVAASVLAFAFARRPSAPPDRVVALDGPPKRSRPVVIASAAPQARPESPPIAAASAALTERERVRATAPSGPLPRRRIPNAAHIGTARRSTGSAPPDLFAEPD